MVGDAGVLRDGGVIEAPPVLRAEPARVPMRYHPVHGEGRRSPLPGDTAIVALAKTRGLAERHPAPLREAAVILRHGQVIAVLECHAVDGPDEPRPPLHHLTSAARVGRVS